MSNIKFKKMISAEVHELDQMDIEDSRTDCAAAGELQLLTEHNFAHEFINCNYIQPILVTAITKSG